MKLRACIRAKVLFVIILFLGGCSPYVYEKEIKIFGEGVEATSQTMSDLKKQRISYLEKERDEGLKQGRSAIDIDTDGCDDLRKKYTDSITKGVPISKDSFAKCHVTPQGASTDPGVSNVLALTEALKRYASALTSITKAQDENDLKSAFSEFNTSTKAMLGALNGELEEKSEKKYDAVSGLVWTAGALILNQRRFNALKDGVNEADPIVKKVALLLQEAAFYLHEKNISSEYREMIDFANSADTSGDYLSNWRQVDQKVVSYVRTIKNSPVNAIVALSRAHASLKESINDPSNQKQLDAVFKNAKAFKDSADAAKEAFK